MANLCIIDYKNKNEKKKEDMRRDNLITTHTLIDIN